MKLSATLTSGFASTGEGLGWNICEPIKFHSLGSSSVGAHHVPAQDCKVIGQFYKPGRGYRKVLTEPGLSDFGRWLTAQLGSFGGSFRLHNLFKFASKQVSRQVSCLQGR